MTLTLPFNLLRPRSSAQVERLDDEVQRCVDRVLVHWAQLRSHAAVPQELPAREPLHILLRLDGPFRAQLAVSGPLSLGALLAVAATGDPGAVSFAREALVELVQLLRDPLFLGVLERDPSDCVSDGPRVVPGRELPSATPKADVQVAVGAYPLRVRLWLA
jgi:hypothetical protein